MDKAKVPSRPGTLAERLQLARVSIDMTKEMIQRLDLQADKRGMSRQSVIKFVLNQWLDEQETK